MRYILLRIVLEVYERILATVEYHVRNRLGEVNLTLLEWIAQTLSLILFLALIVIPIAAFYYAGPGVGLLISAIVVVVFVLFTKSGRKTCPKCGTHCSKRVIVCPTCDHELRDASQDLFT